MGKNVGKLTKRALLRNKRAKKRSQDSSQGLKQLKIKAFFRNSVQSSKRRRMDSDSAETHSTAKKEPESGDEALPLGTDEKFDSSIPRASNESKEEKEERGDELAPSGKTDSHIPQAKGEPAESKAERKPDEVEAKKIKRRAAPLRNEMNDTINYRLDPKMTFEDYPQAKDNYMFYTNKMPLKPDRVYLSEIHSRWFGAYDELELNHNYIQWLFPLGTLGMNYDSQPLQYHEYTELKDDPNFKPLLLKSFELMLDFYGMRMRDDGREITIGRIQEFKPRYTNLIKRSHNLLRITRILKCLGYFGLDEYQKSWIEFLVREIFETKALASLESSMTRFWVHTIRDDSRREDMIRHIEHLIEQDVLSG